MTIDIKNAFSSTPFTTILNGLMKQKLSTTKQKYIMSYLQTRWSEDTAQLTCGCAQGSSLSSYTFCAAID
jgi:hypothetical protein